MEFRECRVGPTGTSLFRIDRSKNSRTPESEDRSAVDTAAAACMGTAVVVGREVADQLAVAGFLFEAIPWRPALRTLSGSLLFSFLSAFQVSGVPLSCP